MSILTRNPVREDGASSPSGPAAEKSAREPWTRKPRTAPAHVELPAATAARI